MKNMSRVNTQDFSSLIGRSYSDIDCWGVVREFYKREFGIELKRYYDDIPSSKDEAKSLIYSHMAEFEKVQKPEEKGDILLIKIMGVESHIAVYLGDGKMLHTSIPTGCIVDKLSKWERMVTGVYRVRKKNVD